MAEICSTASDLSPSDLELAVSTIQATPNLVGYRQVLSYTNALGIQIYSKTSFDLENWTLKGAGSWSRTWEAKLLSAAATVVAIKEPLISFTRAHPVVENDIQHQRLTGIIQELRILANSKLRDHPNLPHVLGVFFREEENPPGIKPCVLFELASSDLKQYLGSSGSGSIQPEELTRLALDVARGIGALHAYGLVHGDIKPENILLFIRNDVLTAAVGDLGTCGSSTQSLGVIPGSLGYCAPEYLGQSQFAAFVNQPSRDVYNFGLLLWSMLTRCKELPFPTSPGRQTVLQHDETKALEHLSRVLDHQTVPEFQKVISECVRPNPQRRPTIFEVSSILDPIASMRSLPKSNIISSYTDFRL